jgi:hypothetical protein
MSCYVSTRYGRPEVHVKPFITTKVVKKLISYEVRVLSLNTSIGSISTLIKGTI